MKRALLLSSILLAGAGCATQSSDVATLQGEALAARANLVDAVFVSDKVFAWRAPDMTMHDVHVRLTFIRAENYDFDGSYFENAGKTGGLEYEVVAEGFDPATGEVFAGFYDRSFFAQSDDSGGFKLYDCDSSRVCRSDEDVTTMALAGDTLTIENHDIAMVYETTPTPELVFTKAAR